MSMASDGSPGEVERTGRGAWISFWVFAGLAGITWLIIGVLGATNPGSQSIWLGQLLVLMIGGFISMIALVIWIVWLVLWAIRNRRERIAQR